MATQTLRGCVVFMLRRPRNIFNQPTLDTSILIDLVDFSGVFGDLRKK